VSGASSWLPPNAKWIARQASSVWAMGGDRRLNAMLSVETSFGETQRKIETAIALIAEFDHFLTERGKNYSKTL